MKGLVVRPVCFCWVLCIWNACSPNENEPPVGYGLSDKREYESEEVYEEPDDYGSLSRSHDQPIDGTYAAEVCNDYTGSCYTLDADVSGGQVETIYFPNGGHLDMDGAELDDGIASGEAYTWEEGYTGETWTVEIPDLEYE
jgi:hypothetical protein